MEARAELTVTVLHTSTFPSHANYPLATRNAVPLDPRHGEEAR